MDDTFNPIQYQGTIWYFVRNTNSGIYWYTYIEIDRNSVGRVTVCASCWWDFSTNKPKVPFLGTSLDFELKDLLNEEQLIQKVNENKINIHPACYIAMFA